MENNVFFSFIMPVYKGKFLEEAINSVLNQSYNNFELIIINDASPENLIEIISSFHSSKIKYYENKQNIGGKDLVKNWNDCIQYATGEYLILASDDDVYYSDFLQSVSILVKEYPDVDLLRSRVCRINNEGDMIDVDQMYQTYMSQKMFMLYWSKGLINCISNYVFRTKALVDEGGFISFPCAWFSDDATIISMAKNGMVNTSLILFRFRSSDINISGQYNFEILKKKIYATDLFYDWFTCSIYRMGFSSDEQLELVTLHYMRLYVVKMLQKNISMIPLSRFAYVMKYLLRNNYLYKKEKIIFYFCYILTNIGKNAK